MASAAHQQSTPRAVVHIRNQYHPDDEREPGEPDRLTNLRSQLASIPPHSKSLTIDEDTPSDAEWELIRDHFTSVNDLELSSGFNEDLNDKIPLHWPLDRLSLVDACGVRVSTPWILEGKIKHLRLFHTCGLRFEGPTNDELVRLHEEKIQRGEVKEDKVGEIRIINLPLLAYQWMHDKYAKEEPQQKKDAGSGDNDGPDSSTTETKVQDGDAAQSQTQLQTHMEMLEIIENDAHDTLFRMTLACGSALDKIKTLYFRATNGCDLHYPQDILLQIFPQLLELRTLTLVLANEYPNPILLTELYQHLPPNVETLHFRGPANLAKSDNWPEWVKSFGDADFRPSLKKLSFVLDLEEKCKWNNSRKEETAESEPESNKEEAMTNDSSISTSEAPDVSATKTQAVSPAQESPDAEQTPTGPEVTKTDPTRPSDKCSKEEYRVAEEDLQFAKRACEQLLSAAEKRGITIEKFSEPELSRWPIDSRW